MHLIILILVFFYSPIFAQDQKIIFEANPDHIDIGDSITIIWDVKEGCNVYISTLGEVSLSGTTRVVPRAKNTSYTLIAETNSGIESRTITVEVEGIKGEDDLPMISDFKHMRSYTLTDSSYVNILGHIHNVLQDSLEFQLTYPYNRFPRKEQRSFLTKFKEDEDMVQQNESNIRIRRIAYYVEVSDPLFQTDEILYTIDAYIEYRRKAERTWQRESKEHIYLREIQKLHNLISKPFD